MHAEEMISAHPQVAGEINAQLIACVEESYDCAQACISCADACLGETTALELRQCIRLNQDCADICTALGAVASRRTGSNESVIRALLDACAEACRLCGEECARHGEHMEHCRICAEECRTCESACLEARESLGSSLQ
jgi:hypothetical protein